MKLILNNDQSLEVNLVSIGDDTIVFDCNGKRSIYQYVQNGSSFLIKTSGGVEKITTNNSSEIVEIFHEGKYYQVKMLKSSGGNINDENVLQTDYLSPMPGKISKISVTLGQKVKKGDVLVYLEAMKMEHPIKAKMDGEVQDINAAVGQQVDQNQLLIKLKCL